MFASKNPMLYYFMIGGIIAVILATLVITANPLALMGLWFIPQVPVVQEGMNADQLQEMINAEGQMLDGDDEGDFPPQGVGFTQELTKQGRI